MLVWVAVLQHVVITVSTGDRQVFVRQQLLAVKLVQEPRVFQGGSKRWGVVAVLNQVRVGERCDIFASCHPRPYSKRTKLVWVPLFIVGL